MLGLFKGKKGSARASEGIHNKGLFSSVWMAWLLATAGFAILLAGVAALQQSCYNGQPNLLETGGAAGYLAPVSCSRFFQYTWWITFLHFFVWAMVLSALVGGYIHKHRSALTGLLAVASVLLMDTANTYLYYNDIGGVTGTLKARTKTVVAGAIIAAIADLLLLLLIGVSDEKPDVYANADTTGAYGHKGAHTGAHTGTHTGTQPHGHVGLPPGSVPVSSTAMADTAPAPAYNV